MNVYEKAEAHGYDTLSARARLIDIMIKGSQELDLVAECFISQLDLEDETYTGFYEPERRALIAAQRLEKTLHDTARKFCSQLKTLLEDFNWKVKRG